MKMRQQLKTDVRIRSFDVRDYEGVVEVANAVLPDRPGTVEEWRYDDEPYDKKFVNERYVAEDLATGTIVGYAGIWHVACGVRARSRHPRNPDMERDQQRADAGDQHEVRVRPAARVGYIHERVVDPVRMRLRDSGERNVHDCAAAHRS